MLGTTYIYINIGSCYVDATNIKVLTELPWPNLQHINICTCVVYNLVNSMIGNRGVRLLSRSNMPVLITLSLCNMLSYIFIEESNIGDEGVKQLTKGHWPQLQTLWLGTYSVMQVSIGSN